MDEIQFTRDLLINNWEFAYTGIFNLEDLFNALNRIVKELGYVQREKKTDELVTEAGKRVHLELRPYKFITPEIKLLIKIKVLLDNVIETKVGPEKYQQGEVRIGLDAWYMTNYKKRWYSKPLIYFIKGVINKYFYEWPEEKNSRDLLVADTAAVHAVIKKLFKTYQPEAKKYPTEEEVMKEMEKEIG